MPTNTVLIVEDDFDIRDLLRDVLAGEGYRTIAAANGQEALQVLRAGERPKLVLLDLMMPVLNGWQFMEAFRVDPTLKDIPVVIVSAQAAAVPGARQVVRKPFSLDAILGVVERYCGPARGIASTG